MVISIGNVRKRGIHSEVVKFHLSYDMQIFLFNMGKQKHGYSLIATHAKELVFGSSESVPEFPIMEAKLGNFLPRARAAINLFLFVVVVTPMRLFTDNNLKICFGYLLKGHWFCHLNLTGNLLASHQRAPCCTICPKGFLKPYCNTQSSYR